MAVNFLGSGGSSSVRRSAVILMFRHSGRKPMVLLVHPGGPFWRNEDRNSWSIPKGEFGNDETRDQEAEDRKTHEPHGTPRWFDQLAKPDVVSRAPGRSTGAHATGGGETRNTLSRP